MHKNKIKPHTDVPLSESTISPSLAAIRERCSDLFTTGNFTNFEIVDSQNDDYALLGGAYSRYAGKKTAASGR